VNAATKNFIAELMLDDDAVDAFTDEADPAVPGAAGATVFLATKLPDRVLLEMQRWILGVYGLRPTGPSSDSSTSSSTEPLGDASTGTSPAAA
jgi:hypothetical protein